MEKQRSAFFKGNGSEESMTKKKDKEEKKKQRNRSEDDDSEADALLKMKKRKVEGRKEENSEILVKFNNREFTEAKKVAGRIFQERELTGTEKAVLNEIEEIWRVDQLFSRNKDIPRSWNRNNCEFWIVKLQELNYPASALNLALATQARFKSRIAANAVAALSEREIIVSTTFDPQAPEDDALGPQINALTETPDVLPDSLLIAYFKLLPKSAMRLDAAFAVSGLLFDRGTYCFPESAVQEKLARYWRNNFGTHEVTLFPLCDGKHFCLVKVDRKHKTVQRYDSIVRYSPFSMAAKDLCELVSQMEGKTFTFQNVAVPQQGNGIDCGVYLMLNVRALIEGREPTFFGHSLDTADGRANDQHTVQVRAHIQQELRQKKISPWVPKESTEPPPKRTKTRSRK